MMGRTNDIHDSSSDSAGWADSKTIAEMAGMAKRHVNRRAKQENWHSRPAIGRGGRHPEYDLSKLPSDILCKIRPFTIEQSNGGHAFALAYEQRLVLEAPIYNRRKWEKYKHLFLKYGHLRGADLDRALESWNAEHADSPSLRCSASAFRREFKRYEDEGPEAIIGKYGRNRGRSYAINSLGEFADQALEIFTGLYLNDNQPAAYGCWLRTAARIWTLTSESSVCDIKDFNETFPSCATFMRALRTRFSEAEICLAREGRDAFDRKHNPSADRDYGEIEAGSVWYSDHHQLDLMCLDENGNPRRPWVTAWRDKLTGYLLSWHVRHDDPSTEVVSQTFIDGVRKHGKPDGAYTDNGKDYRSRQFSGGRKGHKRATLLLLGVTPIFAGPYNGKTKPIERDFRTVCEGFSKFSAGYVGNKPTARPASLEKRIKKGELPTLDEVRSAFDFYIENIYHMQPSKGKVLRGRSRAQAWEEEFHHQLHVVPDEDLRLMHASLSDDRTVRRGAIDWNGHRWFSQELMSHNGRRVFLRIPIGSDARAIVHDAKTGEAICEAVCDALRTPALARTAEQKERVSAVLRSVKATEKRSKAKLKKVAPVDAGSLMMDLKSYLAASNPVQRGEKLAVTNTVLIGRRLADDVVDYVTGEVIAFEGQTINETLLCRIITAAIDEVQCEKEVSNTTALTPLTEVRHTLEEKRATGTNGYTIAVDYVRPAKDDFTSLDIYTGMSE